MTKTPTTVDTPKSKKPRNVAPKVLFIMMKRSELASPNPRSDWESTFDPNTAVNWFLQDQQDNFFVRTEIPRQRQAASGD